MQKNCPGCNSIIYIHETECPYCRYRLRKGNVFVTFFCILGIIVTVALILIPNFIRARAQGSMPKCHSNIKNMATALEIYKTDNDGQYPGELSKLVPRYIKYIPTCPYAGKDTYTGSYTVSGDLDEFNLHCHGSYHPDGKKNYPRYNSVSGFIK